jgi:hypothetical protein
VDFALEQDVHDGFQERGQESRPSAEVVDVGGARTAVSNSCMSYSGGKIVKKGRLIGEFDSRYLSGHKANVFRL